jgi:SMC interacting uncharacterized protein involved in chromosome segregation
LLQKETISSIESWTDIVPEADINTQIGVISDLNNLLSDKEEQLKRIIKQQKEDKGKSEHEKKSQNKEIIKLENQIKKLPRK